MLNRLKLFSVAKFVVLVILSTPGELFADVSLCTVEKPLHIGASVTSGFPSLSLTGSSFARLNPGQRVTRHYIQEHKSEMSTGDRRRLSRTGTTSEVKRGVIASNPFSSKLEHAGITQIEDLINSNGKTSHLYDKATIIFGIDLFYWDAVWDLCRWKNVSGVIDRFIQQTNRDGKTLVLGTVPLDTSEFVPLSNLSINSPFSDQELGFWWPPVASCVETINSTIRQQCLKENNCYYTDLEIIVDHLQKGHSVQVNSGESYTLKDLRPDGVHLSNAGNQFVAEDIIRQMDEHPPTCQN